MRRQPLALAFTLLALAGTARAEVPQVLTDIPPVQSLVAQVMGDLGTPGVLLEKGADPHDFQMRPSQAAAVGRAQLLFWIGPDLTPWLDRAIKGVGVAGKAVALIDVPGTFTMDFKPGESDDAAGDGHGALNPHVWLDPDNAQVWLKTIAADLAAADPEHAATYAANAEAAAAAVTRADDEAKLLLGPVGVAPIVVFHDAFGYYARHYGLNVAGSIALGDAASPGAARLASIHAMLAATGTVCVFPEANQDPKLVTVVTENTQAKVGGALDPAGTTLTYGPGLYAQLIDGIAQTIADCAGR